MTTEQKKKAPLQTLRDGSVFVKLWEQSGKNGPYITATQGRTYFNEQTQQYGESSSLSASDVLKAQALLQQAYPEMGKWREFLVAQQQGQQQNPAQQVQSSQHAQPQAQSQGLAAQRDAVMQKAVPQNQQADPVQAQTQTPQIEP